MRGGQACCVISLAVFMAFSATHASAETVSAPKPKPQIDSAGNIGTPNKPNNRPAPFLGGRKSGATFFEQDGAVPITWSGTDIALGRDQCAKQLAGLNLTYKPVDAIGGPEGCGAAAPIEVSAVFGVKIQPPATLTCSFANVLHRWARGALQQAAKAALNDQLVSLANVASYTCRATRSERASRLSEHALSNALDISAFSFEKSGQVTVTGDWVPVDPADTNKELGAKATFLRYAHESACEVFSTVLGPDHNAFHKDHLHLDHGRDGRFGACQ